MSAFLLGSVLFSFSAYQCDINYPSDCDIWPPVGKSISYNPDISNIK